MRDLTAILPDGREFEFWEREPVFNRTLHVDSGAPNASDDNDGSAEAPLKTIDRAAQLAEAGTRVLIHAGLYRECVRPVRGGTDPEHIVSFEAFGDGPVVIRASEQVRDFRPSTGWRLRFPGEHTGPENVKVWAHELDPDMFRGYNPFCAVNILHDRLFIEYDKTDMTTYLNRRGCVFCDGRPLKQVALYRQLSEAEGTYWVEANGQTVHFRLPGDDSPEGHLIELTVREQCFAPKVPFLAYIRVKGLICEHAATGAPVPQRGAISCGRGHHWVIEDCEVNWSNALAIDVGNECWHHEIEAGQLIGYNVVRGCTIRDAGVCGIAGLFAERMLIEDNVIDGTGWQRMELSWEAGAVKLHNSVDGLIRRNVFKNTLRADHLWLDCGNENTRITSNLFLNGIQQREAIFIECTKEGVNLIDNNVIWNVEGRFDPAKIPVEPGSSGWYKLREGEEINGYGVYCEGTDRLIVAHNLIALCRHSGYYAKPVGFRMGGWQRGGTSRKAKILNNIFYDCGEAAIVFPTMDNESEGNLYLCMQGGYLRVMYPEPETCLDLPTWQEFNGFDRTGQRAWFGLSLDEASMTLRATQRCDSPYDVPGMPGRLKLPGSMGELKTAPALACVPGDFHGAPRDAEQAVPGPFAAWEDVYSLKPSRD